MSTLIGISAAQLPLIDRLILPLSSLHEPFQYLRQHVSNVKREVNMESDEFKLFRRSR